MSTLTPTDRPPAVPAAPLPAVRLLALTVVVAAAIGLVPLAAAALAGEPAEPVAPGSTVVVPLPDEPAFRFAAPAGWSETTVPSNPDRGLVLTRGTDTLVVFATTQETGLDTDAYASRLLRAAAVRTGVAATPAGRASGPGGLTGPRFRVAGPGGAAGELVVLGDGRRGVGLLTLTDPARPVDLRPLVGSLQAVAS